MPIMGAPSLLAHPTAIWSFLGCKRRKPTREAVKHGLQHEAL